MVKPTTAQLLERLASPDRTTRTDAVSAIFSAMGTAEREGTPHALDVALLFEALQARLKQEDPVWDARSFAYGMLRLDRNRAMRVLTSPEFFSANSPCLSGILLAFDQNGEEIALPKGLLAPMMADIKQADATNHAYGHALIALARSDPEAAKPLVEEALQADRKKHWYWRSKAAHAAQLLAGIDPHRVVEEKIRRTGYNSLTLPQRTYFACFDLDAITCNGGFFWYFRQRNAYAEHAAQGFEEIGAKQIAAIVRDAIAVREELNKAGPIVEKEFRERLEPLDRRYYDCGDRLMPQGEDVLDLLALYTLKHPEHFRD